MKAEKECWHVQICWWLPHEPVGSVWIGWESHREQVGTLCCDDHLQDKTENLSTDMPNNAKQGQLPPTPNTVVLVLTLSGPPNSTSSAISSLSSSEESLPSCLANSILLLQGVLRCSTTSNSHRWWVSIWENAIHQSKQPNCKTCSALASRLWPLSNNCR